MDKRIIIYGNGFIGTRVNKILSFYKDSGYKIIGYTNSNGKCDGVLPGNNEFVQRESIDEQVVDYIIVAINSLKEYAKIVEFFQGKFCKDRIIYWETFVNELRKSRILKKYNDSQDCEIQETLQWLREHDLSVRNQYENLEQTFYELFFDVEKGFPYIMFNNHRMYYPKSCEYVERDGKKWIVNVVENDQYAGSPHLYITDEHKIPQDGIIVDAGVAEGNFVLSYIDIIKKAYLFECDPKWLEVLQLTFEPFKDKVVMIPKMLGDYDSDECATLDSTISETVDFIKMDIEGAEVPAVLGGINLLKRSNARLSICTYHRQNDEKYLSFILKALGYKVSFANGRMFFVYDEYIDYSLDFRHGVLYGEKGTDVI